MQEVQKKLGMNYLSIWLTGLCNRPVIFVAPSIASDRSLEVHEEPQRDSKTFMAILKISAPMFLSVIESARK